MAAMTQRKRRIETGILVLLCSGFAALAQEAVRLDGQRIDEALNRMVSDGRAAGVSVLVWKDGKEAHFGAAGFADREAQRPMARDTIAQIYSMTKPITGVALMQLWEQGKFGLDDPLARYLPEFETMKSMRAGMRRACRCIERRRGRLLFATLCGTRRVLRMGRAIRRCMTLT